MNHLFMTKTIILGILISFIGCKTPSKHLYEQIYGTYYTNECSDLQKHLVLSQDRTYEYKAHSYMSHIESHGKWKYNGTDIILNSHEVCEIFQCEENETEIKKWPTDLEIKVIDQSESTLIGAKVNNITTGKLYVTEVNGVCELKLCRKNATSK